MPSDAPPDCLHQRWVHSHEEDHGDEMVFRPASFPFPPSRGRRSIELGKDGTLRGARPGPTDRSEGAEGRWQIEGERLTLFSPGSQSPAQALVIVSASADRLVLRSASG